MPDISKFCDLDMLSRTHRLDEDGKGVPLPPLVVKSSLDGEKEDTDLFGSLSLFTSEAFSARRREEGGFINPSLLPLLLGQGEKFLFGTPF